MRFAPLSFLVFFVACNNDGFLGKDGGDAAGDDGSIPIVEGGGGDGGDADADAQPKAVHRMFVINNDLTGVSALAAWDDADTIAGDRAPDVAIFGGLLLPLAMALAGDRLFVFDDGMSALKAFDKAGALTGNSVPSVGLGSSAFVGSPTPHLQRLIYTNPGDLLITTDDVNSAVQVFANATTLKNGDMAKARFGALTEGMGAAVLDGTDRLFVGEIPQQVIKFATGASAKTGANSLTMDFSGAAMVVRSMLVDSVRLYVGGTLMPSQAVVAIYTLANIQPGAQPDFTLTAGLPTNGAVFDLALVNDVLVVASVGQPASKLLVYKNASTLNAQAQGTPVTTDPMVTRRVRYSQKTGLLYSVGNYKGNPGLQVWKNITTAPALQAEIRTGVGPLPYDVALYEP